MLRGCLDYIFKMDVCIKNIVLIDFADLYPIPHLCILNQNALKHLTAPKDSQHPHRSRSRPPRR